MNQYVNTSVQSVNLDELKEELKEELDAMFLNWLEGHNNSNKSILDGISERLEALEAKGAGTNPTTPTYSPGDQIKTYPYTQYLKKLGHSIGRETVTKLWSEDNEKYPYVRAIAKPVGSEDDKLWEII
jgi:hypothetical protein